MVTERDVKKAWNKHFRTETLSSLDNFNKLNKKFEKETGKRWNPI
jgi:hypothetical protein